MSKTPVMILNGEFVSEQDAAVSPVNRGMMYGDGCFETLRFYAGKLLGWNQHFDRMKAGLHYLGMEANFDPQELKRSIIRLAQENHLLGKEAIIRIQCWRSGGRGYNPASTQSNWMVQISEISPRYEPMELVVANTRCIPNEALQRQYKLTNGLNYIKAAQEASARNADDALMLTMDKKVSETTSANIFWVKGDAVFTPSEECDLLPGVTRSIVTEVCKNLGISLQEGSFPIKDVLEAESIFCTNSLIEIRDVVSIDEREFDLDHPITIKIRAGFEAYKAEHLE
ncbi:MAG: hypothetical protein CL666_06200 [Balneola sp.]|nr:hypothetical protein [Balneola sp.]|tara:strand:- start:59740 stop:60591 length:852 start_codon:yes stop_codon:yes gene_type:complete